MDLIGSWDGSLFGRFSFGLLSLYLSKKSDTFYAKSEGETSSLFNTISF